MRLSKEDFEEFSQACRDYDARGLIGGKFGVARTDQMAAMTESALVECVGLRTEEDVEKILFGTFLSYGMVADTANAISAIGERVGSSGAMNTARVLKEYASLDAFIGVGSIVVASQEAIEEKAIAEEIFSEHSEPDVDLVLELAQEIRRVDGNHDLGAAALAEALVPFIRQKIRDGAP